MQLMFNDAGLHDIFPLNTWLLRQCGKELPQHSSLFIGQIEQKNYKKAET